MKIHFLSHPTAFSLPGGGEVQLIETMKSLSQLGHECVLLDIYDSKEWASINLLHLFSVCNGIEVYARWALDNKIPYVVSPILWAEDYPKDEFDRVRFILLNSKAILPNSFAEMERIAHYLHIDNNDKFHIIHNGFDVNSFLNHSRQNEHVCPRTIVSVANIDKRKNLINLAMAVRRTSSKLIVAGGIRDYSIYKYLVDNFSDCVSLIGPITNSSSVHFELLDKANIFALISLYETPGIAALEAGAAGVPLLLTSVGATKEYFNSFAYYVDPLSVDDIVLNINSIYSRNISSIDAESRSHFSKFSWESAAIQTQHAYKFIL
jgi:glycosyltransferase involved in cell wall biosynthesis